MTYYWQLNGQNLEDAGIKVIVTTANMGQKVRQSLNDIHGGTQSREKLGLDLPTKHLKFVIIGRGLGKFSMLDTILDVLEGEEVWTLRAPNGYAVYKFNQSAAFSTVDIKQNDEKGTATISLEVDAVINGVFIGDGGSYAQPLTGYFTVTGTGPLTYLRNDGVNVGTVPYITVLPQTTGYLQASHYSDFVMSSPTRIADSTAADGTPRWNYTMVNYLWPAPAAIGDVVLYDARSSPLFSALYPLDMLSNLGVGADMVGEMVVGG